MNQDTTPSSTVLRSLAKLGWDGGIRGNSLRRNSLLYPLNTIFNQLQRQQYILDLETQRASLVQKIFNYLEAKVEEFVVEEFVNVFFNDLLGKIYRNNQQRLLADEKDIKAAYLFYIRAEIPQKEKEK